MDSENWPKPGEQWETRNRGIAYVVGINPCVHEDSCNRLVCALTAGDGFSVCRDGMRIGGTQLSDWDLVKKHVPPVVETVEIAIFRNARGSRNVAVVNDALVTSFCNSGHVLLGRKTITITEGEGITDTATQDA